MAAKKQAKKSVSTVSSSGASASSSGPPPVPVYDIIDADIVPVADVGGGCPVDAAAADAGRLPAVVEDAVTPLTDDAAVADPMDADDCLPGKLYSNTLRLHMLQNPLLLQSRIDKYFAEQDAIKNVYTMYGLARSIDVGYDTLQRYEDEYLEVAEAGGKQLDKEGRRQLLRVCSIIKRARDRVRESAEEDLRAGRRNVAGLIFWLKNCAGWRDNVEVSGPGGGAINLAFSRGQDTLSQ